LKKIVTSIGQLSLAILPVGIMNTSQSWGINTTLCTSIELSMISQCKLGCLTYCG